MSNVNNNRKCGSELSAEKAAQMQADLQKAMNDRQAGNNAAPAAPVLTGGTIDVYVHVIQKKAGKAVANGYVAPAMIQKQLDVLNKDYAGADAAHSFKYKLVATDYTTNHPTWYTVAPESAEEKAMKTQLRKGDSNSLNLYLANLGGGLLGWSTFPSDYKAASKMDGVVILNSSLPGGTATKFNLGKTATHEVGHWMGLFHTFQDGCTKPNDMVDDTPQVAQPNFGTPPATTDSCPADGQGPDLVHDFMDYGDDSWLNMFTKGQVARMDQSYTAFRAVAPAARDRIQPADQ